MVSEGLLELLTIGSGQQDDGRITGVVIGIVTNNKDPDGLGRVKLRFPWLSGSTESDWARVATPMAGNGRGLYFLPEVDDEVLVLFERGDVRFPFVIGALWNGKDQAPAGNSDGKTDTVTITADKNIVLEAPEGDIRLEAKQVLIAASKRADIKADTMKIAAQGSLALKGETIDLN
jgi:uncharacterized protein involved in type VI secretion and phage assembly